MYQTSPRFSSPFTVAPPFLSLATGVMPRSLLRSDDFVEWMPRSLLRGSSQAVFFLVSAAPCSATARVRAVTCSQTSLFCGVALAALVRSEPCVGHAVLLAFPLRAASGAGGACILYASRSQLTGHLLLCRRESNTSAASLSP